MYVAIKLIVLVLLSHSYNHISASRSEPEEDEEIILARLKLDEVITINSS